jgi:exo-beta-1,3-glucanase (GH17 family)
LTAATFSVSVPGCASDPSESGVGNVDMTVTLATPPSGPNEQIDRVDVSLWCEGIDPVLGVPRPPQSSPETFSINVSTSQGPEPYNTVGLLEKQGLPAGDCHLSFSAVSNTGNTECTGDITVAIATNETTQSEVVLACIHTPRYGGVRTDGTLNQCAEYRQILVTPTTQSIGNLVDVQAEVYDPDGDPVTVSVQAVGACGNVATIGSDTAASCETVSGCEAVVNTVECTDIGACEIVVAVSDDAFTLCTGLLPDGKNNDAARSTIAVDCTAGPGLCAGVICPDPGECVTGVCDPSDGSCSAQNDAVNTGCDLAGSPGVCDGAGACVQCNDDAQCGATETCVGNVCESTVVCEYEQDFELLAPAPQDQPTSLAEDGWQVGANVFGPDGTTFLYNYFAFPAPNGGAAFSAVATGEGGPDQGTQQLSIYNDYNNADQAAGNIIEAIVFQERTIVAADVGKTVSFTFDAKRGNINDPSGSSTALAFIKTIDPNAGFATTNFITQDTTNLPTTWGTFTVSLPIDAGLVGQTLQFGAQSRATGYEGSGVFYDNMAFCAAGGGGGEIELRPLPEIYATGKAINYSPYRAQGPEVDPPEVPSDADILEDLALLQSAGYNLLRLFGGDAVSENIVALAAANFPEMRFQQGLFLEGLAPGPAADNCQSTLNDSQVATAIRLANTYSNVVTVSVGNETSFYAAFMPLHCLEGYISETRNSVTQPVTADDDYTFYANFFGRSPDNVLRLIDFVSIHTYPFLNYQQWDWRQEGVPAGSLRAEAMMNASLVKAQDNYQVVYDYRYLDALGRSVTVGESLPIVIGETGWKWQQTAPSQEIETYAANPVNARWYYDLMQGWEGSAGGPRTIFTFQAFDEVWKGTDDGWGFWDEFRQPNYVLCGTPAGSACNDPLYAGAGYYSP